MSKYKINVAKQRYNEAREMMLLSALDIVNKLKSGVSEEFKKNQFCFKTEARNYKKTIENHLKEELKKLNLSLTKQQLHSLLKELQNTGNFNQKSRFYETTIAKQQANNCKTSKLLLHFQRQNQIKK